MKIYYQDDAVTIYHGDCREVVPELAVETILTDPPYGIADIWQGGWGHGWGKARSKAPVRNAWDGKAPSLTFLLGLNRPAIIWGGNHFDLPVSRAWLVWRKEINPGLTLGDAELAWTNLDKPIRVFDHPRSKLTGDKVPEHPTTKPLSLMEWCISLLPAGNVVDPYMGGGTTLVAAKLMGRKAIGIEIEERYCEIAVRRLAQEVLPLESAS